MNSQVPNYKKQTNHKFQFSKFKRFDFLKFGPWKLFGNCYLKFESLREAGFTLVEMLTVMVIFIVVGSIIFSILVTSFQTSHKTDTLTQVRQNGNYALTQMAKTLRTATALLSPFPCVTPVVGTSITVTSPSNDQIVYDCSTPPSPSPVVIASNGASLIDSNAVKVTSCQITCTQQSASDLPLIQISFTMTQQNSSSFAEQKASIPFQTSILLRNINR